MARPLYVPITELNDHFQYALLCHVDHYRTWLTLPDTLRLDKADTASNLVEVHGSFEDYSSVGVNEGYEDPSKVFQPTNHFDMEYLVGVVGTGETTEDRVSLNFIDRVSRNVVDNYEAKVFEDIRQAFHACAKVELITVPHFNVKYDALIAKTLDNTLRMKKVNYDERKFARAERFCVVSQALADIIHEHINGETSWDTVHGWEIFVDRFMPDDSLYFGRRKLTFTFGASEPVFFDPVINGRFIFIKGFIFYGVLVNCPDDVMIVRMELC